VGAKDVYRWAQMGTHRNVLHFLQQYHEEGEAILQLIVTGNETWVHHYEPSSKCQSMEWKHVIAQCAFCWQSDIDAVLELTWTSPLTLPGSWTKGHQCTVLCYF
jgi:hypothetical protein